MKREIQDVVRAIVSAEPRFVSTGRLLSLTPVTRILRGVYLERSSSPDEFHVWAFVQPLYVPASTIVFSLGRRLGGSSHRWRATDAESLIGAIRSDGIPFIVDNDTPERLAAWLERRNDRDGNSLEAKAWSFVACGKFERAIEPFDELIAMFDEDVPWQRERKELSLRMRAYCLSAPDRARQVVGECELATRAALDLAAT